jgi:hypothetical protein
MFGLRFLAASLVVAFTLGLLGCEKADQAHVDASAVDDSGANANILSKPVPFCPEGTRQLEQPIHTTADLANAINSLPRPLTLPCLLAALPRPLAVGATTSEVSAQPAVGAANPRLFVQPGRLTLTLALAGQLTDHMETGEPTQPGFSVKGDLKFPVTNVVAEKDFFAALVGTRGNGSSATSCGTCHTQETMLRMVEGVPVFTSRAMKSAKAHLLAPGDIAALERGCAPSDDTLRCRVLHALSWRGPWRDADYSNASLTCHAPPP